MKQNKSGLALRGVGKVATGLIAVGALALAACVQPVDTATQREQALNNLDLDNEALLREVYYAQLGMLLALDQAFEALGQEYYRLEAEYENLGRLELADITREKAYTFHKQHRVLRDELRRVQAVYSRLTRGEAPRPHPLAQAAEDDEGAVMRGAATTQVEIPQGATPPRMQGVIVQQVPAGGARRTPPMQVTPTPGPLPRAVPQVDTQGLAEGDLEVAPDPQETVPREQPVTTTLQMPGPNPEPQGRATRRESPVPTWTPVPARTPAAVRPLSPAGAPR